MKTYLNQLRNILENGKQRPDRTSTGTISIFGLQDRYDLQAGFPAVTTKKLAWRSVVSELLWFIEGSGDERRLREILHGARDSDKGTIWTANANASYWKPKAKYDGDLGRVYGTQWRHWKTTRAIKAGSFKDDLGNYYSTSSGTQEIEIDQLVQLVEGIKRDPYGRRHIVVSYNPGEIDQMALPPCHALFQMYVSDGALSCQMYQRSADFPLGVPFNIASYALLTHMVAQVCDLAVGEFIHSIGDAHIYLNQIEGVKEQLVREPMALPKLWLNPEVRDITKFTMDDIKLIDYQSHPSINFPFAT